MRIVCKGAYTGALKNPRKGKSYRWRTKDKVKKIPIPVAVTRHRALRFVGVASLRASGLQRVVGL